MVWGKRSIIISYDPENKRKAFLGFSRWMLSIAWRLERRSMNREAARGKEIQWTREVMPKSDAASMVIGLLAFVSTVRVVGAEDKIGNVKG